VGSFSLTQTFMRALKERVRLVVFLILPAIAWENMSFVEAAEKGLVVPKTHLGEFARGYALTYAAAAVIYCGLAWSFSLYLEQMFVAQLYLWHLKWERKFGVARLMKRPRPAFKEIEPPALLAQVPAFFGAVADG
jgi:hypothetical protein